MRLRLAGFVLASLAAVLPSLAAAQRTPPPAPADAHAGAPVDLTGQWVAVVTEDWRWRMVTPPVGDYTSVPLNERGIAETAKWDLAADNAAGRQCLAYGPGGLLRQPLRMRLSWADGNTLRIETDAGQQVRDFHFVAAAPGPEVPALTDRTAPGAPSLQGYTRAQWHKYMQSRGLGFGASIGEGGALLAVTGNTTGGYLRKNGVPYSSDAIVTEQFNIAALPSGVTFLVLTTKVDDPAFLSQPFIVSTSFRKETDLSKWSPEPCQTDAPLVPSVKGGAGG